MAGNGNEPATKGDIERLDAKIDGVEQRLEAKIDMVALQVATLTSDVATLHGRVDELGREMAGHFNAGFERLADLLRPVDDKAQSAVDEATAVGARLDEHLGDDVRHVTSTT